MRTMNFDHLHSRLVKSLDARSLMSDFGHFLTAITIYTSLLSYLLALICWVTKQTAGGYRWLWTAGCGLLWAHAACAFHFYLGWSHTMAVAETAAQTEAVLGWPFGQGIWFSYLLMLIWLVDVVWMWRFPEALSTRWSYVSFAVHAYAFFILFNGTVIFEEGIVRWAGVIGTLWAGRLAWRYRRHKRPVSKQEPAA